MFLRMYTLIRVSSVFMSLRKTRVWKTFNNHNMYAFVLKAILERRPLFSYFVMMLLYLIIFSMLYVTCSAIYNTIHPFHTALWVVSQTVLGSVFSDVSVSTVPTRILVMIAMFVGRFVIPSFQCGIINKVGFVSENEYKSFKHIKLLNSKEDKGNVYNIYFEKYIKYKMIKITKRNKPHKRIIRTNSKSTNDDNDLHKIWFYTYLLHERNKMKFNKEKYFSNVLATLRTNLTLNDFITYVKCNMHNDIKMLLCKYSYHFDTVYRYNAYFVESVPVLFATIVNVLQLSNQIANAVKLMNWTGCLFLIDNNDMLGKYKIIDKKVFDIKAREFFLKYKAHYVRKRNRKGGSVLRKTENLTVISGFEHFHLMYPFENNKMYSDDDEYDSEDYEEEDEYDYDMNNKDNSFIEESHGEGSN